MRVTIYKYIKSFTAFGDSYNYRSSLIIQYGNQDGRNDDDEDGVFIRFFHALKSSCILKTNVYFPVLSVNVSMM